MHDGALHDQLAHAIQPSPSTSDGRGNGTCPGPNRTWLVKLQYSTTCTVQYNMYRNCPTSRYQMPATCNCVRLQVRILFCACTDGSLSLSLSLSHPHACHSFAVDVLQI